MKILLNPKRGQSGVILWFVIAVLVVVVVLIGLLAVVMLKTIQKVVPPPTIPPDEDSQSYGIGDEYMGGIITGYTNAPRNFVDSTNYGAMPDVTQLSNITVLIFASDRVDVPVWTNLIWSGPWNDLSNQIGTNGLPIEQWTNGAQPSARFYNVCIQTNQTP